MPPRKKPTLLAQGKPRSLGGGTRAWRIRLYAPGCGRHEVPGDVPGAGPVRASPGSACSVERTLRPKHARSSPRQRPLDTEREACENHGRPAPRLPQRKRYGAEAALEALVAPDPQEVTITELLPQPKRRRSA